MNFFISNAISRKDSINNDKAIRMYGVCSSSKKTLINALRLFDRYFTTNTKN